MVHILVPFGYGVVPVSAALNRHLSCGIGELWGVHIFRRFSTNFISSNSHAFLEFLRGLIFATFTDLVERFEFFLRFSEYVYFAKVDVDLLVGWGALKFHLVSAIRFLSFFLCFFAIFVEFQKLQFVARFKVAFFLGKSRVVTGF